MNMEIILDHQSILQNRQSTIFFAVRLRAEPAPAASEPTAYALILDRNNPSDLVPGLAENIIRHLPPNSELTILSAAEPSEPIYELGDVSDKQSLIALVHQLDPAIAENLSAAWPLACRQLNNSSAANRRILYLTHDPDIESLLSLPTAAAARENVTTSIFAARPGPAADLLAHLAAAGRGRFHKEFSADEFNAVTAGELSALLRPAAQNIRLRIKPLDFCEAIQPLGVHRAHEATLENYGLEYTLGDCLTGEDRTVCFNLEVPRLPCIGGQPVTTLENEPLLEVELHYEEISSTTITPRLLRRTISVEAQSKAAEKEMEPKNFERRSVQAPSPFGRGVG